MMIPQINQNRKDDTQNFEVKLSISDRRKLVHTLDLQGYTNQEISDQVGVSVSSVEKDLCETRQNVREWFSQLGSEERYMAFVDAVLHIDSVQKQLWKMTRDEKDPKERAKLFQQITDNAEKKAGLFKTSEAYLTGYYFKQKDMSAKALAREQLIDSF
jgi:hypothetical protein